MARLAWTDGVWTRFDVRQPNRSTRPFGLAVIPSRDDGRFERPGGLVSSGQSKRQLKAASIRLHEKAGELWKREAGADSSYFICKGATLQVRCRGRPLNAEGGSLHSELADAAVYVVYGGGSLRLVLKKPATASGVPKRHFVMGSAAPKWERKW
ncbi:hypothetical protein ABIC63_002902 [Pseudacidovorax sp. 1753]|uniref:hypothetical protein n=1 Tax=Pseudacidovorax sp. 1753 TaxID=3156419 RepID=UPI0033991A0B